MEKNIHGFGPTEVVELYRYLCIYEGKLGKVQKLIIFENNYPKLKSLHKILSTFVCNKCDVDGLSVVGIVPMNNLMSMTYSRGSKLLSLLHHFRNSIAHGQIEHDGIFIEIRDYKIENGVKRFSARGKIKASTFFEIINTINKNIKLS
jgi:hypothetical protein